MEEFDMNKLPEGGDIDGPIHLDDNAGQMKVSHSPLNLGGTGSVEAVKPPVQKPVAARPADIKGPTGRITGVKTFFTKLHAGAMEFLDEQIVKWLQENPGISIKLTNTTTGEVQGKKTEPNIIISIWY
jgi:hypothetical protein